MVVTDEEIMDALRGMEDAGLIAIDEPEGEMDKTPFCCQMECDKDAEWEIQWTPRSPDDWTHSCTEHVGEMLCDAPIHYIYPLPPRN